ncbi:MAG: hypothetical protein KDC69_05345 [Flavobacteriaceae bacterium]|nr:hypothetical protein [Flavobacteriaceae bacterium]
MNAIKTSVKATINELSLKMDALHIGSIAISEYNKVYLGKYKHDFDFFMSMYRQLLYKAIKKLNRPVSESTFIDYGGGCGILSFLAKEIGFKKVIYNDSYAVSVHDVKEISKALNIVIDAYVHGDIQELVNYINKENVRVDLICSFDVLEHIYDLDHWISSLIAIDSNFSLVFMTGANPRNPLIARRLRKLQVKAELYGQKKERGWKEIDLNTPYINAREEIIRTIFPALAEEELVDLAKRTRGLKKEDIIQEVARYLKHGVMKYAMVHETNTCDPYTGNRVENLIDLEALKRMIVSKQLKVDITNTEYGYSKNKLLNMPKFMLNLIIRISGPHSLFLAPAYTLEIENIPS